MIDSRSLIKCWSSRLIFWRVILSVIKLWRKCYTTSTWIVLKEVFLRSYFIFRKTHVFHKLKSNDYGGCGNNVMLCSVKNSIQMYSVSISNASKGARNFSTWNNFSTLHPSILIQHRSAGKYKLIFNFLKCWQVLTRYYLLMKFLNFYNWHTFLNSFV